MQHGHARMLLNQPIQRACAACTPAPPVREPQLRQSVHGTTLHSMQGTHSYEVRKPRLRQPVHGATLLCMQGTHSYEVREAQLRALSATPAKVSYKLATGPLLSVLEAWLVEGEADQQHKFVRCVRGAGAALRAQQSAPARHVLRASGGGGTKPAAVICVQGAATHTCSCVFVFVCIGVCAMCTRAINFAVPAKLQTHVCTAQHACVVHACMSMTLPMTCAPASTKTCMHASGHTQGVAHSLIYITCSMRTDTQRDIQSTKRRTEH